ncbi:hypothetical protein ASG67_03155 [Sphingomonas sp. Leaf339]|uniref:type II toxin-antitoxin system VapC family toxin n=1 Tax=Sphingomonas sp. Leaf339 TaxID=1736343 RepID=UPI0006F4BD1F|nr:type II toxin-antitoxin system VapC family toxin [Sphingomonas sp. Leaf339]KQU62141.1 hypothetical protein ASG67_03155 [Sphingomonas sp. Leaf339]
MIVDSSAVMAILIGEPESDVLVRALMTADNCRMSAGSWVELAAVLTRSRRDILFEPLQELMTAFSIRIEPTTEEQARIGHAAYRRYGIGAGHPARLNFGDCLAYALAKESGEQLLFNSDDFRHTDVMAAIC